jgi:hypothetical protein
MNGWIKINRDITSHWIFVDSWKFRNWIDLLTMVNYQDKKIELNGQLFVCKRGETLRSIQTLSTRWRCSKSKARRFLKLLESDHMIVLTNETKTTRISICNFDSYQEDRNDNESQTNRRRIADESHTNPNKKDKKDKKDKKEGFKSDLSPFLEKYGSDMLNEFFMYWTEKTPNGKMRFETMKAFSLSRRLSTWAKNQPKFSNDDDKLMSHIKEQIKRGGNNVN